jgi:hypothetical protein
MIRLLGDGPIQVVLQGDVVSVNLIEAARYFHCHCSWYMLATGKSTLTDQDLAQLNFSCG